LERRGKNGERKTQSEKKKGKSRVRGSDRTFSLPLLFPYFSLAIFRATPQLTEHPGRGYWGKQSPLFKSAFF